MDAGLSPDGLKRHIAFTGGMNARTTDYDFVLLEAPSTLGLQSSGVERLSEVLLGEGLAYRLPARHVGRITPERRSGIVDRSTGVLNAPEIANFALRLAEAIGPLLDAHNFPIVLGGDCSIVLGPALALRRRGRYGLLFIDGQADFFQPEAEPNGEAASMDLALVTGHGPALLARLEGHKALFQPADVVQFGYRDHEDQEKYGSQPLPAELVAFDLGTIRRLGVVAAAEAAVRHVTRAELAGFWIHVDADCLDDAVMPAVDFRLPDGLTPEELRIVLRRALETRRAVGLEVTIYNPTLDPDRRAASLLADLLVDALSG